MDSCGSEKTGRAAQGILPSGEGWPVDGVIENRQNGLKWNVGKVDGDRRPF